MIASLEPRSVGIGYAVAERWVRYFQPSTSTADRATLRNSLRAYVLAEADLVRPAIRSCSDMSVIDGPAIPKGTLPVILAAGGIVTAGPMAVAKLSEAGITYEFVFAGCSMGGNTTGTPGDGAAAAGYATRTLEDGTSMVGKVYVPNSDLEVLAKDPNRPLCIVDDVIITGLTVAALLATLRRELGHTGPIYQMTGNCARIDISVGHVSPLMMEEGRARANNVPMYTEHGPALLLRR